VLSQGALSGWLKISLFKKVSLLIVGGSIALSVMNLLFYVNIGVPLLNAILSPSVFVIVIIALYSIACFFIENSLLKIIQIVLFYCLGIIACLQGTFNFYYIGIWSVTLFLAYSYNFFIEHFKIKLLLYGVVCLFFFMLSLLMNGSKEYSLMQSLTYFLVYFLLYAITISTVFKDKIEEYEKLIRNKKIVAELGSRVSVLVHDTKNIVQNISGSLYFLSNGSNKESMEPFIKIITNTLKDVNDRFESLLYLNKEESLAQFDLKDLLRSVVYLYSLNTHSKNIKFNIDSKSQSCLIEGKKLDFFILFDNIVKNAIEAEATSIDIEINKINTSLFVSITDNGKGIEKCFSCNSVNCLSCTHTSNKINGHGIGTQSVSSIINYYKGSLQYFSEKGKTRIVIIF
jgi:signal transduction histidine kinase